MVRRPKPLKVKSKMQSLFILCDLSPYQLQLFFLNLPIWVNFVDPIDLSLYYYLLLHLDQPTFLYSLKLNLNQLNRLRTRLAKQSRFRTVEA